MKLLTVKEIQNEEKKILDEVVKFLEDNSLRYFLCGGTLLGSVRHKGFIPWDDDIDISMPRTDYEKLQKIIKKNANVLGNNLYFQSIELGNLNLPFTKVCNHKIRIYDYRYNDKYEKYLWIDIFPVDGMPEDDKKLNKLLKKRDKIKLFLFYKKMSKKFMTENEKNPVKLFLKMLIKSFYNILPDNMLSKKIVKLSKKYSYEDSSYAGCIVWGYGSRERMKKEMLEEYIDGIFEGDKYKIVKNYDEYLTNIYGDYMTLPPEDKRITHSFEAWRIDESEEKTKK